MDRNQSRRVSIGKRNPVTAGGAAMRRVLALLFATLAAYGQAIQIMPNVYRATQAPDMSNSNTFLIVTTGGNVIVDTSGKGSAPRHYQELRAVSSASVRYIILTHTHADHTGGVALWKETGTVVVAQQECVEFQNYSTMLASFLAIRSAAQSGKPVPPPNPIWAGDFAGTCPATQMFDQEFDFALGQYTFQLIHNPGETPDHLMVYIPQLKLVLSGDNYLDGFPNLYTLRGTQPRWALDWAQSLTNVLSYQPGIVLPSHGPPVYPAATVTASLTKNHDAIMYVHDQTVQGMNAGKDAYTLMSEIQLPPDLQLAENYGKVMWGVRGIYDGYAGFFNTSAAEMYQEPPAAIYPDLANLAGGADAIASLAQQRLASGQLLDVLRLTDVALAAEPANQSAIQTRLSALQALCDLSANAIEKNWLIYSMSLLAP